MQRLADTMERNKELRESVKSALIYPSLLVLVAVVSVAILLVWVVPQFEATFAQAGKALPMPTLVVVMVGKFMRGWWWAVLGCRRCSRPVVSPPRPQSRGAPPSATASACACRCWATSSRRSRPRASRARSRRCSPTA